MKREKDSRKIARNIKDYQIVTKKALTKPEEIEKLYTIIQFKQTKDAIIKLATIATDEQDMDRDFQEVEIQDSDNIILKCALEDQKALIVYKLVCILTMVKVELEVLEGAMILMKMYTDSIEIIQLFDCGSLVYVCSELLRQNRSEKLIMIVSYVIYNVFRSSKLMSIGEDDSLFKAVIEHGLFKDLMQYCVDGRFKDQSLVNIIEALAALSDSECFLDYAATLLAGSSAKLFIRFYDYFVVELLEDPEERGRMLCFDDVLSWIRRERPEVEDE